LTRSFRAADDRFLGEYAYRSASSETPTALVDRGG